mmetsp:Transcript_16505/g.37792  ORF Transcript_16505/g.37792 Transcript_16505/m.37792 type:complete len:208 (+) Transcript_16505:345-968(+)
MRLPRHAQLKHNWSGPPTKESTAARRRHGRSSPVPSQGIQTTRKQAQHTIARHKQQNSSPTQGTRASARTSPKTYTYKASVCKSAGGAQTCSRKRRRSRKKNACASQSKLPSGSLQAVVKSPRATKVTRDRRRRACRAGRRRAHHSHSLKNEKTCSFENSPVLSRCHRRPRRRRVHRLRAPFGVPGVATRSREQNRQWPRRGQRRPQ